MTTSKQTTTIAADCPISMPVPPSDKRPVIHHFMDDQGNHSGWGFTAGGLVLVMSEADREEMFSRIFTPGGE